jgi:hypothetical protein
VLRVSVFSKMLTDVGKDVLDGKYYVRFISMCVCVCIYIYIYMLVLSKDGSHMCINDCLLLGG